MVNSKITKSGEECINLSSASLHDRSKPGSLCYHGYNQDAINRHWAVFPPHAKTFILDSPKGIFPLPKLINFWSMRKNIKYTRDGTTSDVRVTTSHNATCSTFGAAWYLALAHLRLGMTKEARALTINSAFLYQCSITSIERIEKMLSGFGHITGEFLHIEHRLPHLIRGYNSIRSPNEMEEYLQSCIPKEYKLTSVPSCQRYNDQISYDWNDNSNTRSSAHTQSSLSVNDGRQIKITMEDDVNQGHTYSFDISTLTTLKTLFNDYADKRGTSLRLLRFSYGGNTLFLSSAGHKTPEQLGLRDLDVIKVHDTIQESSNDDRSSQAISGSSSQSYKKWKAKKQSNKNSKSKGKKWQHHVDISKTEEEHKVQHSKKLTNIHDEAHAQFKLIRQRLNNLALEQRQTKKKCTRVPKYEPPLPSARENNPFNKDLGGKVGKSRYVIQVGEVQNLYKTTKPTAMRASCTESSCAQILKLDLHGYTREEALAKLDKSLEVWHDAAMRGSYPFVKTAVIVCGCGSQALSETVHDWIRSNNQVANAPALRKL